MPTETLALPGDQPATDDHNFPPDRRITIDAPAVPYPGGRNAQHFYRGAARKLRTGYDAGGSNVRDTIALLLDRTAAALDGLDAAPVAAPAVADPDEHRARLRELATTARDTFGLKGRWGWFGAHGQAFELATQRHGRTFVMQFGRMGMSSGQPIFPAKAEGEKWSIMTPAADMVRFEVCHEATSKDDPRVYRKQIDGIKNPVAEYLAAVDAETVLGLLDEIDALRAQLAERTAVTA